MTKDTRLIDAEMRTRALARWEGEGGALTSARAADSVDESEMRILRASAPRFSTSGTICSSPCRRTSFAAQGRLVAPAITRT